MKVAVFAMKGRAPSASLRAALSKAVLATLKSERSKATGRVRNRGPVLGRGEINIVIVDRAGIRRLNKKFLDETGDTDVIAFPYEPAPGADTPYGDIYISAPVAEENAKRFGDDPRRELVRLAVHGTLHLLGYDDHRPADKKIMWARQEKLVEELAGKKT